MHLQEIFRFNILIHVNFQTICGTSPSSSSGGGPPETSEEQFDWLYGCHHRPHFHRGKLLLLLQQLRQEQQQQQHRLQHGGPRLALRSISGVPTGGNYPQNICANQEGTTGSEPIARSSWSPIHLHDCKLNSIRFISVSPPSLLPPFIHHITLLLYRKITTRAKNYSLIFFQGLCNEGARKTITQNKWKCFFPQQVTRNAITQTIPRVGACVCVCVQGKETMHHPPPVIKENFRW